LKEQLGQPAFECHPLNQYARRFAVILVMVEDPLDKLTPKKLANKVQFVSELNVSGLLRLTRRVAQSAIPQARHRRSSDYQTLKVTPEMAAGATFRLCELHDMVNVREDWENFHARGN
jgi:hypothetical protein